MLILLALAFGPVTPIAHAEDQIDLQWSICEIRAESTARKLDVTVSDGPKSGAITYFDSLPVRYLDRGVTLRVKEKKNTSESSVKVRFPDNRPVSDADCEWDRYGSQETYTCEATGSDVSHKHPWTDEQEKFADRHGRVEWNDLHAFGPYDTLSWKLQIAGRTAHFDTVIVNDNAAPISELSVKVPLSEGDTVYAAVASELRRRGVTLCDRQESKTIRLFRALGLK